jgi:hypothetical protein
MRAEIAQFADARLPPGDPVDPARVVFPPSDLGQPQVPIEFRRDRVAALRRLLEIASAAAEEHMHLLNRADQSLAQDLDAPAESRAGRAAVVHLRRQLGPLGQAT